MSNKSSKLNIPGKSAGSKISNVPEKQPPSEGTQNEQEEFFRLIVENVDDLLVVLDLKGRRLYNSPSYAKLFGSVDGMKNTNSFAEVHPDDQQRVRKAFSDTVKTGRSNRLTYRFVAADGSIHFMESCGDLIRSSQGQPLRVVVVSRDITKRLKEEDDIRFLAFYDALTQLPNRRLLNDRLDQAMAASKRSKRHGALMFIDLDNFKPINDTHGHGAGDILLAQVARRIVSCVREMDTVARFGGDEYVVLLSELNTDKAKSTEQSKKVAEKIRIKLAMPYEIKFKDEKGAEKTVSHDCTASIGVVLFLNHEVSPEVILKWADMMMYQAKEAGRNTVRFYEPDA